MNEDKKPRFGNMRTGRASKCGVCQRRIAETDARIWDNESDLNKPLCLGCAGGRGYVHSGPAPSSAPAAAGISAGQFDELIKRLTRIEERLIQVLGPGDEEMSSEPSLF